MRLLALLSLLIATCANATIITIEPDDFALGQQITSEYAIVSALSGYERHAVYASGAPGDGYQAPTGASMFTRDPTGAVHGWAAADRNGPWFGLFFEFLTPVYEVSFYALNLGYTPGLGIECLAYGQTSGSSCVSPTGILSMSLGESQRYTFTFDQGIERLLLGGGNTTAAIGFDRLEANTVPEPSTLALLSIGLLGMAWRRRRNVLPVASSVRGRAR